MTRTECTESAVPVAVRVGGAGSGRGLRPQGGGPMTSPPVTLSTVDAPRPGSRAARLLIPRSVDVVKDLAADYGVCVRPVSLRRTDLDTGRTEVIDIPCGATLAAKCPACAKRARILRGQQIREGWHRSDEPDPGPAPATSRQR